MIVKRHDCIECTHFIAPVFKEPGNLLCIDEIRTAKCALGKRVMFRKPIYVRETSWNTFNDSGYIRYCNDFEAIKKK